jgi:hypothetical protein
MRLFELEKVDSTAVLVRRVWKVIKEARASAFNKLF